MPVVRKAFTKAGHLNAAYKLWLDELEQDVIQGEFGYEPGEFTVYTTHWADLYEEGLTPRMAWQRALDCIANKRRGDDEAKKANYARIVSEDEYVKDDDKRPA